MSCSTSHSPSPIGLLFIYPFELIALRSFRKHDISEAPAGMNGVAEGDTCLVHGVSLFVFHAAGSIIVALLATDIAVPCGRKFPFQLVRSACIWNCAGVWLWNIATFLISSDTGWKFCKQNMKTVQVQLFSVYAAILTLVKLSGKWPCRI
jgi:hypothetical protein